MNRKLIQEKDRIIIFKLKIKKSEYLLKNGDKAKLSCKKWRDNNKEYSNRKRREKYQERKNDLNYILKKNCRTRIWLALKGKDKFHKTEGLIGCTIEDFKKYIESLWIPGMSWENYTREGWHIDHIVPCFKFDLTREEEQLKCFHYTNLRPLWAIDNYNWKHSITIL